LVLVSTACNRRPDPTPAAGHGNRLNPRSLFGLWKALERQRKTAQAAEARDAFEAAWRGADVELSDAGFRMMVIVRT
jgi:hypothetical protein